MHTSLLFVSLSLATMLAALSDTAFAQTHCGAKRCYKDSGPGPNLDTGAPAPTKYPGELKNHSYILPYAPDDLVHVWNSPESGPCTWEGIVVKGAQSKRACQIYRSQANAGVFKVMFQRNEGKMGSTVTRIFRRNVNAPNAWQVWAEFNEGQVTAVSRDAERFVAAHGRGTDHTKHPALADRYPRQATTDRSTQSPPAGSGTPEAPSGDLGSVLRDQVLRRLR
jgi:hypothetical protein